MKFRKNQADVPNAQNQIQLFPILLINFIGFPWDLTLGIIRVLILNHAGILLVKL
jgi:hypothetical protein